MVGTCMLARRDDEAGSIDRARDGEWSEGIGSASQCLGSPNLFGFEAELEMCTLSHHNSRIGTKSAYRFSVISAQLSPSPLFSHPTSIAPDLLVSLHHLALDHQRRIMLDLPLQHRLRPRELLSQRRVGGPAELRRLVGGDVVGLAVVVLSVCQNQGQVD